MISNIRSGALLLLAVLTTLATTGPTYQRDFATGTYQVKSDCPNAQAEGQLVLTKVENSYYGLYQLNDGITFGFPSNQLIAGSVSDSKAAGKATVADETRVCKALLWETENNSGLFVCHRGKELECTIHLQKI